MFNIGGQEMRHCLKMTHILLIILTIRTHLVYSKDTLILNVCSFPMYYQNRRGRDLMVVGFTATYAVSAYHQYSCEFESRS